MLHSRKGRMGLFESFLFYSTILIGAKQLVIAVPDITQAISFLGNIGSVVKDARNIQVARDPERYEPYERESQPIQSGDRTGSSLFDNIKTNLDKVGKCNVDEKGTCCLLPNFCVPVAECYAKKVTTNLYDLLKAIPTCRCPKGYKGDGQTNGSGCQNVDECTTGEAICQDICEDMSPGYSCGCHSGFRLAEDNYSCDEIDECAEGLDYCEQNCVNTPGSYECSCKTGFVLGPDDHSCIDVDECDLMNKILEYQRAKSNGAILPHPSVEMLSAMNELTICQHPQLCSNLPGGYSCGCPLGFKVNLEDPSSCIDINECVEGISLPNAGTVDPLSPFLDNTANAQSSSVCQSTNDNLSKEATQICVNTEGGFNCECASGYERVSPLKEQLSFDTFLNETIHESGDAVAKQNLYYDKNLKISLSLECRDINECKQEINPCTGLKQRKLQEFLPNHDSPMLPQLMEQSQVFERRSLEAVVLKNIACVNTIGSFKCLCPEGYVHSLELKQCVDIDECSDPALNLCDESVGEQCVNTPGSYNCQCATGYRAESDDISFGGLTPIVCNDINECKEGTDGCVYECRNTPGSYECSCPSGFRKHPSNSTQCVDLNECDYQVCPRHTTCLNLPGNYVCGCTIGNESKTSNNKTIKNNLSLLKRDTHRWLLTLRKQSRLISSSASQEEFKANLIDWESTEMKLRFAELQSELLVISNCQPIDVCSHFNQLSSFCPSGASCLQEKNSVAFSCACPTGSKLVKTKTAVAMPSVSAQDSLRSSRSQESEVPALFSSQAFSRSVANPAVVLGDLLSNGLGLLGGRHLASRDIKSGIYNGNGISMVSMNRKLQKKNYARVFLDKVLTFDQLGIGMNIGLVTNPHSELPLDIPLWYITHLDWRPYITSGSNLPTAMCVDINECVEGLNANHDLRNTCNPNAPCCINLMSSQQYKCSPKRGVIQRVCPPGSIDMTRYV